MNFVSKIIEKAAMSQVSEFSLSHNLLTVTECGSTSDAYADRVVPFCYKVRLGNLLARKKLQLPASNS